MYCKVLKKCVYLCQENSTTLKIMKKTLNVNIGSQAFVIDEDACDVLKSYLDDVSSRLESEVRAEVMDDLEARIAELFRNHLTAPGQVVTLPLVRQTISIIGPASAFGEKTQPGATYAAEPKRRQLYRSRDHKAIAGLCGGLAEYFGWDVAMTRLVTFLLLFLGGVSFWVYIIMWIVIPLEPQPLNRC